MVPRNPATSASQAKLDGSKSHAQSAKEKAEASTQRVSAQSTLEPSNTLGASKSTHTRLPRSASLMTCALNLKRRTDVYIYDLYLSYTNIHTKYPIVKLILRQL